ncbi:response regulator [Rhodoferax ferrireducens]|uniref:response regulator n=1 Tax=Rhodoferax ferrireducens TaxID=192843 RepID=UPI000E0D048D|nr:response regulator [Rhodoferax ferrireducens]
MSDTPRAHVLLVDDDESLRNAIVRVLRPTRRPLLTASTAREAGGLLKRHEVGVIVGEPRDSGLADFFIEARERHPSVVRVILTGYPDMSSVLKAVNEAHPFKLLTKPWLNGELLATVKLAFEQYALNRKRDRLIDEYSSIRTHAERGHAVHVLAALAHSAHSDMNAEAIHDLPVGTLLLRDGAMVLVNPAAQRFLAALGLSALAGVAVADLPAALAALVADAFIAPRRQRMKHRLPDHGRLDYVVLEIAAGTLIAFAPAPLVKQAVVVQGSVS